MCLLPAAISDHAVPEGQLWVWAAEPPQGHQAAEQLPGGAGLPADGAVHPRHVLQQSGQHPLCHAQVPPGLALRPAGAAGERHRRQGTAQEIRWVGFGDWGSSIFIWWHKPYPGVPSKYAPFCSNYFIFRGCIWVSKLLNIFVECTIECSKALILYKLHTKKSLEALKHQVITTILRNMLSLNDAPNYSTWFYLWGGCKVASHNTVPWGIAWCIICPLFLFTLQTSTIIS